MSRLAIIVSVLCIAGCASSSYKEPPANKLSARVTIFGNPVPIVGSYNKVSTNILDAATCKQLAHAESTKHGEQKEIQFAVDEKIVLSLGYAGMRPNVTIGKTPFFVCRDGLSFTPRRGVQYRASLDSRLLPMGICKAGLQELDEQAPNWNAVEVPHVCSEQ